MVDEQPVLLNEREVAFLRMETFHRSRVEAFAKGSTPLKECSGGILVVHMIPEHCVLTRKRFDAADLKKHGNLVFALGDRGGSSRFNVDGLMNYDGHPSVRAYSQVFRDGRLEAAMSDLAYSPDHSGHNGVCFLRDSIVEDGMLRLMPSYLGFCKSIGVDAPIWMFSALIDCEGVRIYTGWGLRGTLNNGIDRSPCYLPEIEITLLDEKPQALLRPWCDMLWQACGMERSFNFDQEGNWRERRR